MAPPIDAAPYLGVASHGTEVARLYPAAAAPGLAGEVGAGICRAGAVRQAPLPACLTALGWC